MAVLSRDQVLARKVAGTVETVHLDGGEVVVRGLSRRQASECGKLDDQDEVENLALHYGLVDPPMSIEDVATWREQDESGQIQRVVDAIQRLSGTAPGQGKDATKSVPGRRRARA